MNRNPCPEAAHLSRAFTTGPGEALRAHLACCQRCAAEWAALEELRRLSRALPFEVPEPARSEQLRAGLLAAAQDVRQRGAGTTRWALAAAAVVLLTLGVGLSAWL